jgi:hypothetical protein
MQVVTWQNNEENFLFLAFSYCSQLFTPILSPKPESETPEDVVLGEILVSGKDSKVISFSCNFANNTYKDFRKIITDMGKKARETGT